MLSSRSFNGRRFVFAILVVFVFVYLYEWGLHGWLLAELYAQTAGLWRPAELLPDYFPWLTAGYALYVIAFGVIYLRFRRTGRMGEGALCGLLVGLLFCATYIIFYAVQPLPLSLVTYWCLGIIVEGLIAGILLAAVYRDRELFV